MTLRSFRTYHNADKQAQYTDVVHLRAVKYHLGHSNAMATVAFPLSFGTEQPPAFEEFTFDEEWAIGAIHAVNLRELRAYTVRADVCNVH